MTWEFTCKLNRPVDTDSEIDLLMDARLGWGAFGLSPSGVRVITDTPDLLTALAWAVRAIETVPGLNVTSIELDPANVRSAARG